MIHHAVEHNSDAWKVMRLGCVGSSEFHRIITPKKMEMAAGRYSLMYEKLAEWLTGQPLPNQVQTQWMERGIEMEDAAVMAYEALTETETSPAGWMTLDDEIIGCTPDRLVGADGDLEIKCPLIQTQVAYALTGLEAEYVTQIQGRMWIHGRKWVDIFSYHPMLSIPPLRVYRNKEYIDKLAPAIERFRDEMLQKRVELEQKYGPFVRPAPEENQNGFLTVEDAEEIIRDRFPG